MINGEEESSPEEPVSHEEQPIVESGWMRLRDSLKTAFAKREKPATYVYEPPAEKPKKIIEEITSWEFQIDYDFDREPILNSHFSINNNSTKKIGDGYISLMQDNVITIFLADRDRESSTAEVSDKVYFCLDQKGMEDLKKKVASESRVFVLDEMKEATDLLATENLKLSVSFENVVYNDLREERYGEKKLKSFSIKFTVNKR